MFVLGNVLVTQDGVWTYPSHEWAMLVYKCCLGESPKWDGKVK